MHIFSAMATFTAKTNTSGANHVLEVNVMKPMYPITTVSAKESYYSLYFKIAFIFSCKMIACLPCYQTAVYLVCSDTDMFGAETL